MAYKERTREEIVADMLKADRDSRDPVGDFLAFVMIVLLLAALFSR